MARGGDPLPGRRVDYQPVARRTDPETSHEAADSVDRDLQREQHVLIRDIIAVFGPMTDQAIWDELQKIPKGKRPSSSGARTRRSELVEMGKVRDSGHKALTEARRRSIMWELVPRS